MIHPSRIQRTVPGDHFQRWQQTLNAMMNLLPRTNDFPIWSDGQEILCEKEEVAEHIADLLDMMCADAIMHTGYYDPEEDRRSGECDEYTGFYYIDFD